jgi:hypothetical protein
VLTSTDVTVMRGVMDTKIIQSLRRELAELDAELHADPRYQKIHHIKELLTLYGASRPLPTTNPRPSAPSGANGHANRSALSSKNAKMEQRVEEILAQHGVLHRKVILDDLVAQGLMGTEKNMMAHLASFLSDRRDRYASDGRGNFRLRREGDTQNGSAGSEEPAEDHPIGA